MALFYLLLCRFVGVGFGQSPMQRIKRGGELAGDGAGESNSRQASTTRVRTATRKVWASQACSRVMGPS